MPKRYTCDGDDVSPPLLWTHAPSGTRELVLLVEDPDAPSGTFVHWSVGRIPPDATSSPEGGIPPDAVEGENSFGSRGWRGPCPPHGDDPHRYRFLLYALSIFSGIAPGDSPDRVNAAIKRGHAKARGVLEVRFGR